MTDDFNQVMVPAAPADGAVAAASRPDRPSTTWARRFFGVVKRPRTYLNLIYLLLAFPLGIFYFSFFVSMLATSLSTVIVWVGIPLLALTALFWWAFAVVERYLADGLLGTHLVPAPKPWRNATGVWPRIKAHTGAAATWKDLVFLFVKFPLGIISFVLVTVVVSVPLVFITAPISVNWADWTSTAIKPEERGFYLQTWHVDNLIEAIVFVPVGVLLMFVGLHAINGMAVLWRMAAAALLETDPAPAAATTVAGATPAALPQPPTGTGPEVLPQPPAGWTPTYSGAAPAPATYLNAPGPGEVAAYAWPQQEPQHEPEPPTLSPPTPETDTPPPAPQRRDRTQPPKPQIWEDDDA